MSLLLLLGQFLLWAILSLVSGVIAGYGLSIGFDGFKKTKEWVEKRKNENYLTGLEKKVILGKQEAGVTV